MQNNIDRNRGYFFWFIAAIFYGYEFIHRVIPSILTNDLRIHFNVSEEDLGQIGAMYFYAYALFQIPAGILIDRFGVKHVLIFASAILTVGSFMFSLTDSSIVAMLSRFLIGAGSAFAFIACLKIASLWLASSLFPLMVGLTNLFGTLGALVGGMPLSYAISYFGSKNILMSLSIFGLILILFMCFFLREKKQAAHPIHSKELFSGLWLVIKTKQSWLIAFYGAFLVMPIIALPEMWGVEYLKIAYHLPATTAASITSTIFVGTAIGGPIIGFLMTILKHRTRFMFLATLIALLGLMIFIYVIQMPYYYLYPVLFCYGFFTANMLLCFTLISNIHPYWAQGAAISFVNAFIMLVGGFAQHVTGYILEYLRVQHDFLYLVKDYQLALTFLPFCLGIAAILTFFIKEPRQHV